MADIVSYEIGKKKKGKIELVHDIITKYKCQAIVCPTSSYLDHRGGREIRIEDRAMKVENRIQERIMKEGGMSIFEELKRNAHRKVMWPGQVYNTGAGKLPMKYVIHMLTVKYYRPKFDKRPNEDLLNEGIRNALKRCRTQRLESVGFPLIGVRDIEYVEAVGDSEHVKAIKEFGISVSKSAEMIGLNAKIAIKKPYQSVPSRIGIVCDTEEDYALAKQTLDMFLV